MENSGKNIGHDFKGGDLRLGDKATISALFDEGLRASDGRATLIARRQSPALAVPRLAVAAGVRLGGAVKRNRVKRLYREAFRLLRNELPGGVDFVVVPRSLSGLTLAAAMQTVSTLARRLMEKLEKK